MGLEVAEEVSGKVTVVVDLTVNATFPVKEKFTASATVTQTAVLVRLAMLTVSLELATCSSTSSCAL